MRAATFNKNTALFSMCNLSEFSMSVMGIFQHLNFAETFAVAPLGVRFKFADASGIRSNLPQLS